jgi:hypothetical protein
MPAEALDDPAGRTRDHHLPIALVSTAVVLVGFAPTFYLNRWLGHRDLDAMRIAHGVVFSLWPLLLVTQVLLARTGRVAHHRLLGAVGAGLAVLMVILGTAVAVHAGRHGFQTPGLPPPRIFMVIPIFDMAVFSALVGAAVALRRQRADHWRLMVLATVSILPAAFARMSIPGLPDPIIKSFVPAVLLLLACVVSDAIGQRRVHRAWIWGGGLFLLSIPLRLAIAGTSEWQGFAGWLIGA